MIDNSPPKLITIQQFCQDYSCGRSTVYREAHAGRLRLRKLGGATRIAVADADAWAASLPDAAQVRA